MDGNSVQPLDEIQLVDWRALPPGQRHAWWEQLWEGAVALSERYRLALRSRWWDDPIQVEALAAFDCWLRLYDTGAETDPTGKLQLLWELERLRGVLRGGDHAFDKTRDRAAFEGHLTRIVIASGAGPTDPGAPPDQDQLAGELDAVSVRMLELRQRRAALRSEITTGDAGDIDLTQAHRDLHELEQALEELGLREAELRSRADREYPILGPTGLHR